jgi:hypothetical protein
MRHELVQATGRQTRKIAVTLRNIIGAGLSLIMLSGADARAGQGEFIEIRVELPKMEFKIGETITFAVSANHDCNFLVYTIDPSGKVELHDPVVSGAYMGHPLLKAGEHRQIPTADAPGRAVVTAPAGRYEIGAVCSRDDLDKLGMSQVQLREPAMSGRRSFQFHLDERAKEMDRHNLARTTVAYDVRD